MASMARHSKLLKHGRGFSRPQPALAIIKHAGGQYVPVGRNDCLIARLVQHLVRLGELPEQAPCDQIHTGVHHGERTKDVG
jgi:hypothetical protein